MAERLITSALVRWLKSRLSPKNAVSKKVNSRIKRYYPYEANKFVGRLREKIFRIETRLHGLVTVSESGIARLANQLSSPIEAEAKEAATLLDGLLCPSYRPGMYRSDEAVHIDRKHYDALRGSDAIKPLLKTLVEGNDFARGYVAVVLGAIEDRRALPLLVGALSDKSPAVRQAASQAVWYF